MSALQKGSKVNMHTFGNCLDAIVEEDLSSWGETCFFMVSFGKLYSNYNWRSDMRYEQLGAYKQAFSFN